MKVAYTTLRALKEALDQGELQVNPEAGDGLILDSDSAYFYSDDACVFRMHPTDLLEQALDLLGIPWETA